MPKEAWVDEGRWHFDCRMPEGMGWSIRHLTSDSVLAIHHIVIATGSVQVIHASSANETQGHCHQSSRAVVISGYTQRCLAATRVYSLTLTSRARMRAEARNPATGCKVHILPVLALSTMETDVLDILSMDE